MPTTTAKANFPHGSVCGRKRFNDFCLRSSILWNNPYSYLSWLGILLSLCNSLHPILLLHFQCFGGAGRAAEGRENGCYSQKHEAQQHQNETIKTSSFKQQGEETFSGLLWRTGVLRAHNTSNNIDIHIIHIVRILRTKFKKVDT